jgi:hypothetical protein
MTDTSGPNYAGAISSIESGGNYGILGPRTRSGDQAYGKYQIMGANIPQWTREVLGAPMTPQEFLANPQAQDTVFSAKFGQYVNKYGPEGAARAWFAGPGGMNNLNAKDVNGMTVGQYGQRFSAAMAPPLGTTEVGAGPPIGAPQPPAAAPQLPAAPQQQQPPPGGAQMAAGAPSGQQQPIQAILQQLAAYRPQVNQMPLQNFMGQLPQTLLPANLKPFSF